MNAAFNSIGVPGDRWEGWLAVEAGGGVVAVAVAEWHNGIMAEWQCANGAIWLGRTMAG